MLKAVTYAIVGYMAELHLTPLAQVTDMLASSITLPARNSDADDVVDPNNAPGHSTESPLTSWVPRLKEKFFHDDSRPRLRGWLHFGFAPVALIAGIVFLIINPSIAMRVTGGIYTLTAVNLFGVSAAYHLGNWSYKVGRVFQKLDHNNIFIFIAGTATPLTIAVLPARSAAILLSLIWGCAVVGVILQFAWPQAPRWISTGFYILMGWAAVWWLPSFWTLGGPAVVVWLLVGGLFYTVGAVCYALKRPNPSPSWFGFHEIFHTCTILGAVSHYIAILCAIF